MTNLSKLPAIGALIIMTASPLAATEPTRLNPQGLYDPAANGYSHVVIAPAGGRTVYVSGQGGNFDERGGMSGDFAVQVKEAYANLRVALEAAGARADQVVKLTVYVVGHDESKFAVLTPAVMEMFGAALPAQTLVPVERLAVRAMLFEVEAVAVIE